MRTNFFSAATVLICLIFCGFNSPVNAQDPYLQKSNRKVRQMASDITRAYQPRLIMGAEQAIMFRQKVAEFLIHRQWVEDNPRLSPKQKYTLLKKISSRETSEMAQVLEHYKWQEYMRLKPGIQPLPEPPKRLEAIALSRPTKQ